MSALAAACALAAPAAAGAQINWVDWTGASGSSVYGTMNVGGTSIGVVYTGPAAFYQLSGGTDYWRQNGVTPWAAYDGINAPTGTDMIALSDAGTHSLTFSQSVDGLFMAFVSMGQPNLPVTYTFSSAISGVHEGQGHWGDGTYLQPAPEVIQGFEMHGYGDFDASLTKLTWTTSPTEYWHGFNVGVTAVTATPEPATVLLLGSGLIAVGAVARKRRKTAA